MASLENENNKLKTESKATIPRNKKPEPIPKHKLPIRQLSELLRNMYFLCKLVGWGGGGVTYSSYATGSLIQIVFSYGNENVDPSKRIILFLFCT